MTAILILGLFTVFQESGSPPVAVDTGMIHGILVDTKRGEVAFTAARFFEPWTGPERITLSSGPTCFIPRLLLQRMFPPECMPTLGG